MNLVGDSHFICETGRTAKFKDNHLVIANKLCILVELRDIATLASYTLYAF